MVSAEARGGAPATIQARATNARPDPEDPFSYPTTSPAEVARALLLFAELIRSDDLCHQLQGTVMLRKLVSAESPPLSDIIAAGVGPSLVGFLGRDEQPLLQASAAGALAAIATGRGEHVEYLFSINAAPPLVQLLRSPDPTCRGTAALAAVSNLAVENAACRDKMIELGAVEAILFALNQPYDEPPVIRDTTRALCSLCFRTRAPDLEALAPAIPTLVRLLDHADDDVVKGAAWALGYLTDGSTERLARILAHIPLPQLVRLLDRPTTALAGSENQTLTQTLTAAGATVVPLVDYAAPLLLPILRIFSNVVTGDEHQTQAVIDAGVLQRFEGLLDHSDPRIRREVCFALSNVLAGTAQQIQSVIDECLLPILLHRCFHASEAEVEKEAVWAVANCASQGTPQQVEYLVAIGVLDALQKKLFECSNPKLLPLALEALADVLAQGERRRLEADLEWNPLWVRIDVEPLARQLEAFLSHESDEVVQLATHLLDQYFPECSDDSQTH